jgi:hypothetical protein
MIRKPFSIGILSAFLLTLNGCFFYSPASKKDKIVKKISSDLREKEIVFYANFVGTENGAHLALRKENLFDFSSHYTFGWSYYSGTWEYLNNSDTIALNYMHDHRSIWRYAVIYGDNLSLVINPMDSLNRTWEFKVAHNVLE